MASPVLEFPPAAKDRAAINRENAQHSTGPRTQAGKNRVRLNALKHGALSRTVVFPYENQADYDALGAQLAAQYAPATEDERGILANIQATHWRLARVLSLESNLYAVGIREELQTAKNFFPDLDHEAHIGIARARAYRENARTFDQFHRQEMRLRRLLDKQVQSYLDLQSSESDLEPDPQPEIASAASAETGFVSHDDSDPSVMPHYIGPLKEFKRKQWEKKHAK